MKKALLLCASHNDLGLIRALKKLGYYIIVTGNIPGQIGQKYADKYIKADYSDKELILEIAKREKIDAICQCCNDFGVYTAAYVAEKLNLPGYDSYETTLLLHNKDKFKKFANDNGLISPKSYMFGDKKSACDYIEKVDYPIIVKPSDASAGNGIQKADNKEEAFKAIEYAFSVSRIKKIVIERFINGTQHGFCTFLVDKKVVTYATNNEYSFINPYRVEIDTYPADNFEKVSDILIKQIEKIAKLLDLKDGIFHLQYIMEDDKPQIIEVMRRVLGNMYSVPANKLNNIDWDYWEVRAKTGLSCKEFPKNIGQSGFFAYKTILAEKNGQITKIEIPLRYKKYIYDKCILKAVGDNIENYKSEPIGFLFMQFDSMEEMKKILIEDYKNDIVKMKENQYE